MLVISDERGEGTVEKEDTITLKIFDLGFDIDPLFKKMSSLFDATGSTTDTLL